MVEPPPDPPDSSRESSVLAPEEAARVLRAVYFWAFICALGITLSASFDGGTRVAFLGGSSALVFLSLLFLSRTDYVALSGALGTAFLVALVSLGVWTGYGVRDLSLPALAFIILLANLVLSKRAALVATSTTWLIGVALVVLEYVGAYRTPFSDHTSLTSVGVWACISLAIALSAQRLVRAFHDGVDRARLQELSYQHIFNATTEAIFLVDPQSERIIDVNQSAQAMLGYSRQEFLRSSLQLLAAKHQGAQHVVEMMEAGMRGDPLLFEWTVTSKGGSELAVEVSLRPTRIGTQKVLLAVMRDATETRRIQAKLQESEKLQAVGQLAGGIAHDFNNQLTGILANASLLREKVQDPRLKRSAEVIERCSRRSADLTAQLLAFARRGKHQNVDVDVQELVLEVIELLKHTIDKRIIIVSHLANEPLHVRGDPTLLQNALLNLGLNSRDAMPQGGTLTFSTRRHLVETTQTGFAISLTQGEYVKIEVKDTGSGIDPSILKRIFEPFFTTKASGNGMGLAAVYGAVESHRGDISVDSSSGEGTTFTMLLPLSEAKLDSIKMPTKLRHFDGIRVLLAEDEADVARTTRALLEALGCTVTHCANGLDAVARYKKSPTAFDLVLADHMMPGLTGREAIREMGALTPNIRAVITSGYSTDVVIEGGGPETQHFLPKPFNQKQLSQCLARVLDPSGEPDSQTENEAPSTATR